MKITDSVLQKIIKLLFPKPSKNIEDRGMLVCTNCEKKIVLGEQEIFDYAYCFECTKLKKLARDYTSESDSYEVFVFSYPWNEYIKSYAPPRKIWLPVYQADIGHFNIPRTVNRNLIPLDSIFASITISISSNGSFSYSLNVPALITIQEPHRMLCAYVRDDVYRSRVRF